MVVPATIGRSISRLQSWVKWLAIASMVLDHLGAILFPEALGWRVVGRVAFPAFVGLIAYNVAARGVPVRRYLSRMGAFALISQVPFMLAGFDGLNVFVTLGLGLVLWGVWRRELPVWWGALFALAPWADYGVAGVLLVPVSVALVEGRRGWLLPVALLLLAVGQGSVLWGGTALGVVMVAGLVGWAITCVITVPEIGRGPRWLFYWFYPVHIAVLVVLRWLLDVGRVA